MSNLTTDHPTATPRPLPQQAAKQSVMTVTVAELKKFIRPGGIRGYLITAAALSWVLSGLFLYLLSFPSLREGEVVTAGQIYGIATLVAALVMCVAVSNYVPKEISEGTLGLSKLLVPRFSVLFVGRTLAWLMTTLVTTIAVALPAWLATLAFGYVDQSQFSKDLGAQAVTLMLASLLVLMLFGTALVVQRSGLVVLVSLLVLVILPMVFAASGLFLPEAVSKVLGNVSKGLVGSLIAQTLVQGLDTAQSWHSALKYLAGVAAWSFAMVGLGWVWFRRPAFGTS